MKYNAYVIYQGKPSQCGLDFDSLQDANGWLDVKAREIGESGHMDPFYEFISIPTDDDRNRILHPSKQTEPRQNPYIVFNLKGETVDVEVRPKLTHKPECVICLDASGLRGLIANAQDILDRMIEPIDPQPITPRKGSARYFGPQYDPK